MQMINALVKTQNNHGGAAEWAGSPKLECVGHNAFGPSNNWPVCSLVVACKIS